MVLRTLFPGDVFEHQHAADRLARGLEERRSGQIDRGSAAVRQQEIGVGMVVGGAHRGNVIEAARNPGVAVAEELRGRLIEHLVAAHPQNTFCCLVDLDDIQVLIERNDAIG